MWLSEVGKAQLEDWAVNTQGPKEFTQARFLVPTTELSRTMDFLNQQLSVDILGTDLSMWAA